MSAVVSDTAAGAGASVGVAAGVSAVAASLLAVVPGILRVAATAAGPAGDGEAALDLLQRLDGVAVWLGCCLAVAVLQKAVMSNTPDMNALSSTCNTIS